MDAHVAEASDLAGKVLALSDTDKHRLLMYLTGMAPANTRHALAWLEAQP